MPRWLGSPSVFLCVFSRKAKCGITLLFGLLEPGTVFLVG
jgi:hypothetical protein